MLYTRLEKEQAEELFNTKHTVASALKALTLSSSYKTLADAIYVSNAEQAKLNELEFIEDFTRGKFTQVGTFDKYVVVLSDKDGTEYVMYMGSFDNVSTTYAPSLSEFQPKHGWIESKAQEIADLHGGYTFKV